MPEHSVGMPNLAGWSEEQLGELCENISRGTAPSYVEDSPVKAIGQRCVQNSGFDASRARSHDHRISRVFWARPEDVLLNSTGTGTIGRSCIFDRAEPFMVDSHVTVLRVHPSRLDSRWLNSILRSPWGRQYLESFCYTGSTNQIELSRKALAGTRIPVPPLEEQRRIVEILDALDEWSQRQKKVVDKLLLVGRGVLEEELLRVNSRSQSYVRLDTVAEVGSGVTLGGEVERGVELPYLRVANVQDGFIDISEMKTVKVARSEVQRYLLEAGDVLLTEGGDIDKLGRGAVWDGRIDPCACQNHIFRVRCWRDVIHPEFLAAYIGSVAGKKYFLSIAKQTTNLATINSTQLKSMPVPLPPLEEQERLVSLLEEHRRRVSLEVSLVDKLLSLKRGLAEDLLAGRVRVLEAEALIENR